MRINIAIDGPSAAGKSTIAKALCKRLGYVHLDTGAMYRCTAYKAIEKNIALNDEERIVRELKNTDITLKSDGRVVLDGKDVTLAIRKEEISLAASNVSKNPMVRVELVKRQQAMAKDKGFIMDGRDIGTVVLPSAELKIFLTASPYARAKRRYNQDKELGICDKTIDEIAKEIEMRDYEDTHRAASPLTKAKDAILVDTSDLTIEETIDRLYLLAKEKTEGEKECR